MKPLEKFTRDEKSLLLYLETCAVDLSGRVNNERMNDEDKQIIMKWVKEDFIQYGRIHHLGTNNQGANWCHLSEEAFTLAHELRRQRASRQWENKLYLTTEEARIL